MVLMKCSDLFSSDGGSICSTLYYVTQRASKFIGKRRNGVLLFAMSTTKCGGIWAPLVFLTEASVDD